MAGLVDHGPAARAAAPGAAARPPGDALAGSPPVLASSSKPARPAVCRPVCCAWPARCQWPAWLITSTLPELLRACQGVRWPMVCRWWPPARSRRGWPTLAVKTLSPVRTGTGDNFKDSGDRKIYTRQRLRVSVPVSPLSPVQNVQGRNFSAIKAFEVLDWSLGFDSPKVNHAQSIHSCRARKGQSRPRHAGTFAGTSSELAILS